MKCVSKKLMYFICKYQRKTIELAVLAVFLAAAGAMAGGAILGEMTLVGVAYDNYKKDGKKLDEVRMAESSGVGDNTKHGNTRLRERGFSQDKVDDIVQNYSQKVYQEGGRTVYAKKTGNYYDVIIKNTNGEIVTAVGGNTKSLKTWKDVVRMLNNNGGCSTIPY